MAMTYLKPMLIFLLVITYIGMLFALSLKYSDKTCLKTELNTWIARPVAVGIFICLPFSIFFAYYEIVHQDASLVMIVGVLIPFILLLIDFLITNPKRKFLLKLADTKFFEIKLINKNPQHSFYALESAEVYNQDYPIYGAKSYLVGVALNRVCKNLHDEYFHIFCSYWNDWSEVEIHRIDKNMALTELYKKR